MLVLKEKCTKLGKQLFEGDVTYSKKQLWIIGIICVLLGILIGLIQAPLTHGITISCGNNNGNVYGLNDKDEM